MRTERRRGWLRRRGARAATGLAAAALLGACAGGLDAPRLREIFAPQPRTLVPPLAAEPGVDLPAPRGLRATSGSLRRVPLAWEPTLSSGVAGYAIERSLSPEGPFERIAVVAGATTTVFVDRGLDGAAKFGGAPEQPSDLGDGATYHYRLRAFDPSGALAHEASAVATATTAPAPEPPTGLRAYSGQPREVPLSWTASQDADVASYVLYRSPTSRGPFERLSEVEGRFATQYVDRGLGDLRVFYYRVSARNAAGGEGDPSEPVRAVTKPEPLPPLGLRVTGQRLGANRIAWEPNVESDLAGYRLMRLREGSDDAELVAVVDAGRTSADDVAVGAGERLSYTAVAFDRDGLESAHARPIEVRSQDYGLSARAGADGVQLTWDPRPAERFTRARVFRQGVLRRREIGRSENGEGSFLDRAVSPGDLVRYVVILERDDASRAPPSSVLEVRIPR